MRIRQLIVILIGALIAPASLLAQNEAAVRVRAIDSDGAPIRGALVALIDPVGKIVVERLTDDSGLRILTAPPG